MLLMMGVQAAVAMDKGRSKEAEPEISNRRPTTENDPETPIVGDERSEKRGDLVSQRQPGPTGKHMDRLWSLIAFLVIIAVAVVIAVVLRDRLDLLGAIALVIVAIATAIRVSVTLFYPGNSRNEVL